MTALFFFLLARAAPVILRTALSVTLRPLFPFQQTQYAQVSLLKPASFCTFFAGFGSTNKSYHFSSICLLLCSDHPILSSIFPFTSIFLAGTFSSPPVLSGCNGFRILVFPGKDAADKLAKREALLAPSAIPCSDSPLFSDWRRTVSSKFVDSQVPSISIEKLVLPRHTRCVLSRLRCNRHTLLLSSYLFRIVRIAKPSCSACVHSSQDTSHLILCCPAADSLRRSLFCDSLYDLWSRPWRVARLLRLRGLPPCPHPSEGVG